MLDLDVQTRLAEATTELMRSCAVAAAQTMTASASRGLTLWSDMSRSPRRRPASPPIRISSAANPFEVFWRFAPMDWMPKTNVWPQGGWMPGYASGLGWTPYAAAWGSSPYTAWPMFADWATWSRMYWPAWTAQPIHAGPFAIPEAVTQSAVRATSPSTYASYRSAGGHAVAQVIMPGAEAVVAGMAATAAFTQMQTMLGMWRTALGA